jgi:hypothetical protein
MISNLTIVRRSQRTVANWIRPFIPIAVQPLGRFGTSLLLLAVFAVVAFSGDASNVVYTVEGRLQYEQVKPNRKIDIAFTVCVSDCLWSITATSSDMRGVTFKQVYDGDVMTSATQFPAEVRERSTIGNDSTLGIKSGDMPDCLPPVGAGQIWLAYASACKFSGGTTGLMEPVWFVGLDRLRNRFSTPASWMSMAARPFLPSEVDYFFDANLFHQARANSSMPPRTASQTSPVTKWASYRVTAFTNIGSLLLPKAFQFNAYNQAKVPTQTPVLVYEYRGNLIKAYEKVATDAFDHGFGTKTFVQDERFISPANPAGFVRYVATTNKTIPQTDNPQLVTAAIQASRTQVLAPAGPANNRGQSLAGVFQAIRRARAYFTRPVLILLVSGFVLFSVVFMLARRGKSD